MLLHKFLAGSKNRCEVGIMKSPTCFYEKGASNALLLRSTIRKILAEFRLIAVECRCISTSTHRVCFEAKSYFSRLVRKPVLVVSDHVRHKPDCTITVKWLATLHLGSTGYVLSM